MKLKVYNVVHEYSVDGGYGDAVSVESVIRCFVNKEDAEDFVDRYSKERVYDRPYDELTCGMLYVQEQKLLTHEDYISEEELFWLPEINGFLPDELVTKSQAKETFLLYLKAEVDSEIKNEVKAVADEKHIAITNTFDADKFIERFIQNYNLSYELLEDFLEKDLETYKKELNDKAKERAESILNVLENNHVNV